MASENKTAIELKNIIYNTILLVTNKNHFYVLAIQDILLIQEYNFCNFKMKCLYKKKYYEKNSREKFL